MDTVENNCVADINSTEILGSEKEEPCAVEVKNEGDYSLKEWIREKYAFLKEEKNLGVITWLTTLGTTLVVAYLKLIKYVSERGKVACWNLPVSVIDMASDNVVYDIIMSVVFATVIMVIMLLPFLVIKSKMRLLHKIASNLLVAVSISLVMFFSGDVKDIVQNNGWSGLLAFIAADIVFLVMFFSPSLLFWLSALFPRRNKAPAKRAIVFLTILFVFSVLYFYGASYLLSENKTQYRMTHDGYAIVYEADDHYYLAKYDTENGKIDKGTQKIIEKTNVEYTWVIIDK